MSKEPSESRPESTGAKDAPRASAFPSPPIWEKLKDLETRLRQVEMAEEVHHQVRKVNEEHQKKLRYMRIAALCTIGASFALTVALALLKAVWAAVRSDFVELLNRGM